VAWERWRGIRCGTDPDAAVLGCDYAVAPGWTLTGRLSCRALLPQRVGSRMCATRSARRHQRRASRKARRKAISDPVASTMTHRSRGRVAERFCRLERLVRFLRLPICGHFHVLRRLGLLQRRTASPRGLRRKAQLACLRQMSAVQGACFVRLAFAAAFFAGAGTIGTYDDGIRGSNGEYRERTLPVDSFEPNPWGLYQVHGNVTEWV